MKYTADVISQNDYYPLRSVHTEFGMLPCSEYSELPNRHEAGNEYRWGFNGMEKDDEIAGEGNSYDFGARLYNSRIGRWMSVDPLEAKYADLSPYSFVANNPIIFIDPDGKKFVNPYKITMDDAQLKVTERQTVYDDMISVHEGKLKNKDIKRYRNESGLSSAQKTLRVETSKHQEVEDYFYTLKVTNKEEYDYFENLKDSRGEQMNIEVYLNGINKNTTNLGQTSNFQIYGDYTPTAKNNTIRIDLFESVQGYSSEFSIYNTGRNYNTFANELGDIKYMFTKIKDKASYEFWDNTAAGTDAGYDDPNGAGVYSFEYEDARVKDVKEYVIDASNKAAGESKDAVKNVIKKRE